MTKISYKGGCILYIKKIVDIISMCLDEKIINIQKSDSLIKYGLDSVSFIQLIILIEEEFNIVVPDEYLLIEQMDTIEKIEQILEKILEEK